jgi:excinuclease ABC subunit A
VNRLVEAGHTVILIEHHMDVIKTADHVIALGPEGGHAGGEVVVAGTPEQVARCKAPHTRPVPEAASRALDGLRQGRVRHGVR